MHVAKRHVAVLTVLCVLVAQRTEEGRGTGWHVTKRRLLVRRAYSTTRVALNPLGVLNVPVPVPLLRYLVEGEARRA